jgi:hypothetical protein
MADASRERKLKAICIVVLNKVVPEPRSSLRGALAFFDAAQAAILQIAADCFPKTTERIFNDSLSRTER